MNNDGVIIGDNDLLFGIEVEENGFDVDNFEGGSFVRHIGDIIKVGNFDLYFLESFVELVLSSQTVMSVELKVGGSTIIFSENDGQ